MLSEGGVLTRRQKPVGRRQLKLLLTAFCLLSSSPRNSFTKAPFPVEYLSNGRPASPPHHHPPRHRGEREDGTKIPGTAHQSAQYGHGGAFCVRVLRVRAVPLLLHHGGGKLQKND